MRSLPKPDIQRIAQRMQLLADNPRPSGCKKLTAQKGYRIRQGDYRILYAIDDRERVVEIVKIGHRREVYR